MRSPAICMLTRASRKFFSASPPSRRYTSVRRCASDCRISLRPSWIVTCHAYQSGAANSTSETIPSATYPRARESAEERIKRSLLVAGRHHVSCIADGAQQRTLEFRVDLLPQLADVYVDHVGLRI